MPASRVQTARSGVRLASTRLRDRNVELDEGELFVVPRRVEHRPRTEDEAAVLLIEPAGSVNTGEAGGPRTTVAQADLNRVRF
jgi:mannose-6-phosphate isomerase-like protein (cupin superfamily)